MKLSVRSTLALLVFAMAFTVCGCGGRSGSTATPTAPALVTPAVNVTPAANTITTAAPWHL